MPKMRVENESICDHQAKAPDKQDQDHDCRSAEREESLFPLPKQIRDCLKHPPCPGGDVIAQQAGANPCIKHSHKDVGENDHEQERAGDLFPQREQSMASHANLQTMDLELLLTGVR